MAEQFSNSATSILNGTITSLDTTLTVQNSTRFPLQPQFRLRIEEEILLVTAVSGTQFTVTRGIEGTTPAPHFFGTTVAHVLTAGGLLQGVSEAATAAAEAAAGDIAEDAAAAALLSPAKQLTAPPTDADFSSVPSPGALAIDTVTGLYYYRTPTVNTFATFLSVTGGTFNVPGSGILFPVSAVTPSIDQTDTASGNGQNMTISAQGSSAGSSTGGALVLTSGTGTWAAGNVNIQTGGSTRVSITPTTTSFADGSGTAMTLTPASAGTTTITLASGVLGLTMNQTSSTTASGAFWQLVSQSTSFETGTGGSLSFVAGNATGTAGTGGSIDIRAGTGNTANGTVNFRLAGTTFAQWRALTASTATLQWVSAQTPTINQANNVTNGATGAAMTIQAQNATGTTSTGGALNLTSGTGTTTAGSVDLQTGGTSRILIAPTQATVNLPTVQFASGVSSPTINQAQVAGAGQNLSISAQNSTGAAGGNLVLSGGSGSGTQGSVRLAIAGTLGVQINPSSTGQSLYQVVTGATSVLFQQANNTTNSATAAPWTIQAANATGTTATGGTLNLTSGTGTTVAGNVDLQTGGTSRFLVTPTIITVGLPTQQFATAVVSPVIRQQDDATNSITGDAFTVQAQNATGTTATGGDLNLTSGTGTTSAGTVNIQTGGSTRIAFSPTAVTVTTPAITWAAAAVSPSIRQTNDATNSITGDALTIQAQNATGTTTTGGALNLTSGTGTTANGALKLQVGGTDVFSCDSTTQITNKGTTIIYNGNAVGTITEYIRSVTTNNNTITDIFTWTITDEAVSLVDVAITVSRDTGATAGAYKRQIVFKRDAGTVSTVSASVDNLTGEDAAGLDVTVDNSTSTGRVRVTGITSENYRWFAAIRIQETRAT